MEQDKLKELNDKLEQIKSLMKEYNILAKDNEYYQRLGVAVSESYSDSEPEWWSEDCIISIDYPADDDSWFPSQIC